MVWVFVFGGIALAGLVMLVAYGVWLAHKTSDVLSEVGVLADRTDQLAALLAQIEVPDRRTPFAGRHGGLTDDADLHPAAST